MEKQECCSGDEGTEAGWTKVLRSSGKGGKSRTKGKKLGIAGILARTLLHEKILAERTRLLGKKGKRTGKATTKGYREKRKSPREKPCPEKLPNVRGSREESEVRSQRSRKEKNAHRPE